MALASPATREFPSDDELDDILNGVADAREPITSNIQTQTEPSRESRPPNTAEGLGLDEEVKIAKKRQPIPKLDDTRLLSDPGIPKLRRISKERLKFKGKGHEYGDIARMLNMYQLWLDDLYPRAKFADGLAIIEKLGHSKRMQMMRKEWIDEGKPRHNSENEEYDVDVVLPDEETQARPQDEDDMQIDRTGSNDISRADVPNISNPINHAEEGTRDEDPDEDELDALLAENDAPHAAPTTVLPSRSAATEEDPFAEEMAAMAEMEDMW